MSGWLWGSKKEDASAAAAPDQREKTFAFGGSSETSAVPGRGAGADTRGGSAPPSHPQTTSPAAATVEPRPSFQDAYQTLRNADLAAIAPAMGVFNPRQAEYIDLGNPGSQYLDKVTYRMGIAYLTGLSLGGSFGMLEGLFLGQKGNFRLRMNSVLNATTRRGPKAANALGILSMLYCSFEWLSGFLRNEDDALNTIIGAAAAGSFYKCTGGLRRMAVAGTVGAGIGGILSASAYVRDENLQLDSESLIRASKELAEGVQTVVHQLKSKISTGMAPAAAEKSDAAK